LAKLLKANLITLSYIPERSVEDLRELTRFRIKLMETLTEYKIKLKAILAEACIGLGKVLSDIFGKNGLIILEGISKGYGIDEIIMNSNSKFLLKRRVNSENF
jgi:hypothetical protein